MPGLHTRQNIGSWEIHAERVQNEKAVYEYDRSKVAMGRYAIVAVGRERGRPIADPDHQRRTEPGVGSGIEEAGLGLGAVVLKFDFPTSRRYYEP